MKIAVVIGATGLVGQSLLALLTEDPEYEKIIILQRRETSQSHRKIESYVIDFSRFQSEAKTLKIAASDREIIGYCCLGTTIKKAGSRANFRLVDETYVLEFGKYLEELNATHLAVVSSLGASPRSLSFYARVKGQMEQGVQQLKIPSISILRPSLLLGNRSEKRPAEDLFKAMTPLLRGPLFDSIRGIESFDVAKAMVALAENPKPGFSIYPSDEIRIIANSY